MSTQRSRKAHTAPETQEYLRAAEVARRMHVSPRQVFRWLRAGTLDGIRIGKVVRVDPQSVDRLLASSRIGGH